MGVDESSLFGKYTQLVLIEEGWLLVRMKTIEHMVPVDILLEILSYFRSGLLWFLLYYRFFPSIKRSLLIGFGVLVDQKLTFGSFLQVFKEELQRLA